MPDIGDAALGARARRAAARVGLKACKSRHRHGSIDNFGHFQLIDPVRNVIIDGARFELSALNVIDYCSHLLRKREGGTPDAGLLEDAGARDEVAAEHVPRRMSDLSRGTVFVGSSYLTRDGKIDVLPEPPEPADREFALDTYPELVAKARKLRERLKGANSARRVCDSIERLLTADASYLRNPEHRELFLSGLRLAAGEAT
jgi:hypothetical protein